MTLWRLILAVIALSYAGFGFAFLFKPDEWGALVSVAFTTSAGRTDFRAVYGGLEFGVGVFLLLCALRREFVRLGLFASACALVASRNSRINSRYGGCDTLTMRRLSVSNGSISFASECALERTPRRPRRLSRSVRPGASTAVGTNAMLP